MHQNFRRLLAGVIPALAVTASLSVPQTALAAATNSPAAKSATTSSTALAKGGLATNTLDFRGVNWADPRDNFASDAVVPTGLSTKDSYATTHAKASVIIDNFSVKLKANTVRLPINPSSVGTAWWRSYQGAIDAATEQGFKVILSYWESNDSKDGKIDNIARYNAMWDTVVKRYRSNPRVYFEPMNEPHGYTLDEWVSVTSRWLARHYNVPRNRVVISGTGYNDNVTGVGATPELRGTLLSLHFYGYWADDTTESAWKKNLTPRIGRYGWRTVIDEAGSPMTTGLNYGNHTGNTSTSYLGALTEVARNRHMGIVYWPGLREGDAYSLTTRVNRNHLQVTNASGLAQLQWGWGLLRKEPSNTMPPAPPGEPLRSVASDRCLDVPGFATTDGTALDLYDCNAGGNQSWNIEDQQVSVYASKCLAIGGDGTSAGSPAVIADCAKSPQQTWTLKSDGSLVSLQSPGLCLTAATTDNGSAVTAERCTGDTRQQWSRS